MESKFLSLNLKLAPICPYSNPAKSVFYAPSKLDYLPLAEHNLNSLASPFLLYCSFTWKASFSICPVDLLKPSQYHSTYEAITYKNS